MSVMTTAAVNAAGEVIEEMESRHPENTIARAVLDAVSSEALGNDRLVRLGDVLDLLRGHEEIRCPEVPAAKITESAWIARLFERHTWR